MLKQLVAVTLAHWISKGKPSVKLCLNISSSFFFTDMSYFQQPLQKLLKRLQKVIYKRTLYSVLCQSSGTNAELR